MRRSRELVLVAQATGECGSVGAPPRAEGALRLRPALRHLALALSASALLAGCVGAPEPGDLAAAGPSAAVPGDEPVAEAEQVLQVEQTACVTVQRGVFGTVADDTIVQPSPNQNQGAGATLLVGSPNHNHQQSLIRFDLGFVPTPKEAVVLSATVTLTQAAPGGSGTVKVFAATAPWVESTVTWNSFAGAVAPASSASFVSTVTTQPVSFDITALAQSWLSGRTVNDGLVLDEAGAIAATYIPSSESMTASFRPKLVICYFTDRGHSGSATVTGGVSFTTPHYRGVVTLGESPGGVRSTSPSYQVNSGLIGATQPKF